MKKFFLSFLLSLFHYTVEILEISKQQREILKLLFIIIKKFIITYR